MIKRGFEEKTNNAFLQKIEEMQDLKIELESINRSLDATHAKIMNNKITQNQAIAITQLLNERIKAAKISLNKLYESSGWFEHQDN